ncbi:MAG TPA: hypothetical protein PLD20_17935 [Blastocatellia bacterium]|nr:hypothetical protein [Blastocatellia bacterium]HMX26663.1 hypothetical protein [Blastocatellia bacterium]HMZ19821.1 hypothetical protein [Blastocatellia bacterium]
MKKVMTTQQAETSQGRGILFVRDVLEDDDRADELEDESLDEWAARKGVEIIENPKNKLFRVKEKNSMATKQQLEDRIAELESELEEASEREARIIDALGIELTDDEEDDDEGEDSQEEEEE